MGSKLVVGINDLASCRPDIAAQWHPTMNGDITPQDVTPKTKDSFWWIHLDEKTNLTHYWEMSVQERIRDRKGINGGGCSVCHGYQINIGINDLASQRQNVASEWHPTLNGGLTPQEVTVACGDKAWWQKDCFNDGVFHEWPAVITNRTSADSGCAVCHGQYVQIGVNDINTTHPELASEWHPTLNGELTPQMVTRGSREEIVWQKDYFQNDIFHIWHNEVRERVHKGRTGGCSICAGTQIQLGVNDLASQFSDLIPEWHPTLNGGLTPQTIAKSSEQEIWWVKDCLNNGTFHEWPVSLRYRTRFNRTGCKVCREIKTNIKTNNLSITHPEIASEWHPTLNGELTPQMVRSGNKKNKNAWWIKDCLNDGVFHIWEGLINERTKATRPSKCKVCLGLLLQAGANDLASQFSTIAEEWHPTLNGTLKPEDVVFNESRIVWWQKDCLKDGVMHIWDAPVNRRVKNKRENDCSVCSGYKLQVGVNDLASQDTRVAAEWHPNKNGTLTPSMVVKSNIIKVW